MPHVSGPLQSCPPLLTNGFPTLVTKERNTLKYLPHMQPPGTKLHLATGVTSVMSNHYTLRYLADMMPIDRHVAHWVMQHAHMIEQ